MIVGNYFFEFYGILGAVFITAILLAILEITYIHKCLFQEKEIFNVFKMLNTKYFTVLWLILLKYLFRLTNMVMQKLHLPGFILVLINGSILMAFNYLINNKNYLQIYL